MCDGSSIAQDLLYESTFASCKVPCQTPSQVSIALTALYELAVEELGIVKKYGQNVAPQIIQMPADAMVDDMLINQAAFLIVWKNTIIRKFHRLAA